MESKICTSCGKKKTIDDFVKQILNGKVCYYTCKECNRLKTRKYYKENRELILKKQKERRNNYSIEEKIKISQKRKIYSDFHKEEKKEYDKKYRSENRNKITSRQNEWKKKKIKSDEVFRLKENLKNSIYYSFKRKQKYKDDSKLYNIIGCDWEYFYNYLLQTFENNYGYKYDYKEKIHIDHIIPLVTATSKEEVIKLFNYKNLQLLKPEDNLKKGKNII